MNATPRVLLIDPTAESRRALEDRLQGLGDIRLIESCSSYSAGGEAAARAAADVIIIVLDHDAEAALGFIANLARTRPEAAILPASHAPAVDLVLKAIRSGSREFLSLPITAEDLGAAILRVMPSTPVGSTEPPRARSEVLAILGAAGGIGCTTIAVNLAAALAKDPTREVALVDLDLILGAVDASLDLLPDQTLADVAKCVDRLDLTLLKRSLTRHASGVHVLAGPASLDEASKIDPGSLQNVLERLCDTFPIVSLDLSKSLSESDVIALHMATSILLVVQLEPTCLRNSARLLELLRQQFAGIEDRINVVANRVGSNGFEVSAKKAEELLKVPVKWQVPNDLKIFSAARTRGVPVESEAPGSRAHRAILEIARDFGSTESERFKSRFGRIAASFF